MIENVRLSLQGIVSHKIRSFLTMLGIIIGIAAIIAIVSTIEGTNEQIKNNLIGAGNNTVKISLMEGDSETDFSWTPVPDNIRVISEDSKKRIVDLSEVESCTLYRQRDTLDNLFYLNKKIESSIIYGIDEDYFSTMGYEIAEGIGFSDKQYNDFSKVAIIDTNMQRGLFEGENPIGKILDINGEPFRIIGVACKRTGFEPVINSVEDYFTYNSSSSGLIFIPTNDWGILFHYDEPQNCVVRAKDTDSMTGAGKKTADILNENIQKASVDTEQQPEEGMANTLEYKSESLLEQAKKLQDLSKSTNQMLIWIAGISLLVGGIGVMNIMLVSVTERTREIGLKKALGARKTRILAQFLTEASVLTTIGGILGVLIGIGLSEVIANIAEVPVSISTPAIIVSVAFSMVVGIVFGLIPSIKAANLNPIDALRYE
ncbi:ABC transporter permease [Ruminococcus sp.]|uniref:ABC transporter permease n=1 Tax=Ruminococcus sp. TaxID=41978 RepID=UPI002583C6A4|nr:ABC transporter permease [Ruminococcus sp.]MCR5021396.1 ABC transporter permease [Ruminococcus sp.]